MVSDLIGWVGLRGTDIDPGSGLYIDELPGLSFVQIDSVKEFNYEGEEANQITSAYDVWQIIERRAANVFMLDLKSGLHNIGYKTRCTSEVFTTKYRSELTYPFLYRIGIEVLKERLHSSRVNSFTLIDIDRGKELLEDFEKELPIKLQAAIRGIDISQDDECFFKIPSIYEVYDLP